MTRLAVAGTRGLGAWLLMDSVDDERAVTERARDEQKRAVLSERAARWDAERRERDEKLRLTQLEREEKQRLRRAKEWRKTREEWWRQTRRRAKQTIHLARTWRYALATSKPLARLKNGVKLLTGARQPMTPRIVLGMTLYNNAGHLREATDSILCQTHGDFALLMLDDGSSDEAEAIAREYERRDDRVRYWKHAERQGMVPTWKEVVEIARREHPRAEYFAWVSDHDRWDSRWLARMVAELDSHPSAMLAYPQTLRIDEHGQLMEKEPRVFDTSGIDDRQGRWRHFSWNGFGSGDMVYGLMRTPRP